MLPLQYFARCLMLRKTSWKIKHNNAELDVYFEDFPRFLDWIHLAPIEASTRGNNSKHLVPISFSLEMAVNPSRIEKFPKLCCLWRAWVSYSVWQVWQVLILIFWMNGVFHLSGSNVTIFGPTGSCSLRTTMTRIIARQQVLWGE